MNILKRNRRALRLVKAYDQVFSTPDGREVLEDLAHKFWLTATGHIPGDTHTTAFNEGQRSVVLHILQALRTDTARIITTIQGAEANVRSELTD